MKWDWHDGTLPNKRNKEKKKRKITEGTEKFQRKVKRILRKSESTQPKRNKCWLNCLLAGVSNVKNGFSIWEFIWHNCFPLLTAVQNVRFRLQRTFTSMWHRSNFTLNFKWKGMLDAPKNRNYANGNRLCWLKDVLKIWIYIFSSNRKPNFDSF